MKSHGIKLDNSIAVLLRALNEVETFSEGAGADIRTARKLRLLAEELVAIAGDVLSPFDGKLWVVKEHNRFEIHLTTAAIIEDTAKKELISISKAKANSPVRGIKNRISSIFADFVAGYNETVQYNPQFGFIDAMPYYNIYSPGLIWSMKEYTKAVSDEGAHEDMHEAAKSIIDGFADDVVVCVKDSFVEIIAIVLIKDK